jgi:hypothetical protein
MLARWHALVVATTLLATSARASADETEPPSPPAAWLKGEGFRIQSADGNWKLRVGLQVAFQWEPRFPEGGPNNWSNFPLPYVRPRINGTLLRPWIEYWCSLEFRQFPPFLLDCYMDFRPWKFFGLRAGQFWTLLSRHEYLGPQELVFVSWAPTADYFWTGRDRGVQLFGETNYIDWYTQHHRRHDAHQHDDGSGELPVPGARVDQPARRRRPDRDAVDRHRQAGSVPLLVHAARRVRARESERGRLQQRIVPRAHAARRAHLRHRRHRSARSVEALRALR